MVETKDKSTKKLIYCYYHNKVLIDKGRFTKIIYFLVQMKTLKFAFKINWPLIVPSDFQTFLRSWLRGNSAKQKQCFCIFWLAFRTLFPKVQWERPIKSKWVEPWTFGSIDLKCCIWWFWIRTFDIYEIIWKVSTYHVHKYLLD